MPGVMVRVTDDDFPGFAPWPEVVADNVVPIRDDVPSYLDEPTETDSEELPLLALIDPASWAGNDAPERRWKVKDYIPDGQATLLTGKGAAGKSLVSQQQCTCIALGLPFLGLETVKTVSLYITCEDDADELHRRQKSICNSLNVPLEQLSGKVHLLSLQGEMGNEMATFDHEGRLHVSARYEQILAACLAHSIKFVVLDNTAHLFTGNENDRHQVAAFINLCNRLAIAISGAVVIVGHPNKAGDSYSGSTAWENQVRSRLFMEMPVDENDIPEHPDLRVMRREKVNYAQRGGELRFMWHHGAFVLEGDIPEDKRLDIAHCAQDASENERFMDCLAKATAAKRNVSHVNGISYAPRIFAGMPASRGLREDAFARAMERLINLGAIELEANLWKGPNRHWKTGIKAAESAPTPRANPAPSPRADPRQPHSQVIENIAPILRRADPLYTTYIDGGSPEEPPPSWLDEPPPWEPDDRPGPGDYDPPDLDWRDNPILNGKDS